jgi:signal transduction histidine kinase
MFLLEKQVLSRLSRLSKSINSIGTSGDISARVSMPGTDELSILAGTINGMLAALQQSEGELQELYQNEKELRRKLEEEINKRIEFTRALVHELKTPITPVLASSELLLQKLKDEPFLSLAQNINQGATNLNQRIDELLDSAKGEMGMLQLNPEPVDPMQLLQRIVNEETPVALCNRQSLNVELPPSLPVVCVDEERFRQVVFNLMNNAFKFTPEEGKIILKAREEGANLIVEVQDTGPGISEEEQKQLFEPYHRLKSDRERLSGLGLGLSLSKKLVELHGGQIWVRSQKGKGSTFGFSIPLEATEQREENAEVG